MANTTTGFSDNGAVYGSQKVTTTPPATGGSGAGTYVAKNIKVAAASADRKTTTDEMGNEAKQFFMGKIPTGTMSLQLPDTTTPVPAQYSTVPLVPIGGGTAVVYIIYEVGETFDVGGETMCDVSIAKKMAT